MVDLDKGEEIFRPKARIIRSLGDELISSEFVAINELVKNSYDAGSPEVLIIFEDNKILIKDNGCGMDYNDFKYSWLEPATNFKKKNKSRANGKLGTVQGEKGIGRFAVTKLAKKLKLISKKENKPTYEINFDWNSFYKEEKYLDEVKVIWEKKENLNNLFDKGSGTILELDDLNINWDEDKINDLKKFVRRLLNPFEEINEFNIKLIYNNIEESLEPSDTLENPMYKARGEFLCKEKKIRLEYSSKKRSEEIIKEIDSEKEFDCGSFNFEFRIWDLDPESLNELKEDLNKLKIKDIKDDLKAAGGISIYRDNFRILPYGEEGDDWLRLDLRRVNNPSLKLSNNQIVGYLGINIDKNKELTDQTNREGLIENEAFHQLKELTIEILEVIENRRYKDKRTTEEDIEEEINVNKSFTEVDFGDLKEKVSQSYPEDKETLNLITTKEKEVKTQTAKFKKLILRYRRLSTLGQLLDNVVHETNHYFSSFSSNIHLIKNLLNKDNFEIEKVKEALGRIEEAKINMENFIERLKPFTGRRRDTPKLIDIEKTIRNILELKTLEIKENNINVNLIGNSFNLEIREIDFNTVITNLLENSIYWLKNNKNEKLINIELNSEEKSLIFSDNGPGISEEDQKYIFNPYFSMKKDGAGIGLSIVGEIVSEYKGELGLYESEEFAGACFKIKFQNG